MKSAVTQTRELIPAYLTTKYYFKLHFNHLTKKLK